MATSANIRCADRITASPFGACDFSSAGPPPVDTIGNWQDFRGCRGLARVQQRLRQRLRRFAGGGPGRRVGRPDLHVHGLGRAAPFERQLQHLADRSEPDFVAQLCRAADRHAVHFHHHVAFAKSRPFGGRTGAHLANQRSFIAPRAFGRSHILQRYADAAALYLAGLYDLLHDLAGHVDRDGEADPDIAAAGRKYRRVDADEFASEADEPPTGIAGVDRRVGLDEVLIPLFAQPGAAKRTDQPGRDGLSQAERIADRNHEIADFQAVAVAQRYGLEAVAALELQDCNIRRWIAADELGGKSAAVLGDDLRRGDLRDDVIGGQYDAALRIDDHAGAAGFDFLLQLLRHVEKFPEERILVERIVLAHFAVDRDVDHGRRDLADERRERRDATGRKIGYLRRRRRGERACDEDEQGNEPARSCRTWNHRGVLIWPLITIPDVGLGPRQTRKSSLPYPPLSNMGSGESDAVGRPADRPRRAIGAAPRCGGKRIRTRAWIFKRVQWGGNRKNFLRGPERWLATSLCSSNRKNAAPLLFPVFLAPIWYKIASTRAHEARELEGEDGYEPQSGSVFDGGRDRHRCAGGELRACR